LDCDDIVYLTARQRETHTNKQRISYLLELCKKRKKKKSKKKHIKEEGEGETKAKAKAKANEVLFQEEKNYK